MVTMTPFLSLALLSVAVLATSPFYHVYHPSAFQKNAKCFECREYQVCIVSAHDHNCVEKRFALNQIGEAKFVEYGNHSEKISHHHKHSTSVDHIKHDHLGKKECSVSQLQAVGGRLVLWFSQIRANYVNAEEMLAEVMPVGSCGADTAWMFSQWDGNDDGYLTRAELASLEGDHKTEPCLPQFFDHCDDMQTDGLISLAEWCDCLAFADDVRHEPACHKEKHARDPHLKTSFVPRCDADGFYSAEQCQGGECWCVDKYGRTMDGSRVTGELPDCGQYASKLSDAELQDLHARM